MECCILNEIEFKIERKFDRVLSDKYLNPYRKVHEKYLIQ